jgi:hypothetical protein
MLPAALEATTVTPPVELGEIAAAETTAVELVEAASAPPEKEIIAEATTEPDLSSSTSLDDTRSVVAVEDDRTRPDWVGVGEERLPNGVFRMTSTAGPYSSTEECFQTIAGQTQGIVIRYVGRLLGSEAAAQLKVPQGFVESALIKDQWIGEVESATLGTTMYEMHVLVEFDDAARRQLELMWHQAQIQERLAMTGAASGLVLLLLGTTFGYLKLDTATRGFYSGRLKLAAGAIAAAATAALAGVLGVL